MDLLRRSVRLALSTDLSVFEHLRPIRSAIVMLVVLGVAYGRNDVRALLPLGVGLLFASIADRGVSFPRRMTSMWSATVGITIGTCVGCLISSNQFLHVTVAGIVAAICALIGAGSVPAMTTGVLSLVVLTIFSGSPIDLLDWRSNTLLMLLGACIMITTVMVEFAIFELLGRRRASISEMPTTPYLTRLREHLHWNDEFVLHTIRLSIVIMAATALEELLTFPHSYWIPMTVAWIARPDRDGTIEKVTLRVAGTLAGVAIAGILIGLTPATSGESILMIGVATYIVLAFIAPNYAIAVTGITIFVFFLFHLVGYPLDGSILTRIASTLMAAALVLLAIHIGPRKAPSAT